MKNPIHGLASLNKLKFRRQQNGPEQIFKPIRRDLRVPWSGKKFSRNLGLLLAGRAAEKILISPLNETVARTRRKIKRYRTLTGDLCQLPVVGPFSEHKEANLRPNV